MATNDMLTPRKIVEALDHYIVGQAKAKKDSSDCAQK